MRNDLKLIIPIIFLPVNTHSRYFIYCHISIFIFGGIYIAIKRILIFDPTIGSFESFLRQEHEPMPYAGPSLSVGEFKGASRSSLLWSDRRFLHTWRDFREYYGQPIHVGYCFKRIWEGGHGLQSQHYAGGSFDTGQNLTNAGRAVLRQSATSFGRWSYVEPAELTPTWVHFDRRLGPPACSALRAFQANNSLDADGIAGCATWQSLTRQAVGIGRTATVVDP